MAADKVTMATHRVDMVVGNVTTLVDKVIMSVSYSFRLKRDS